MKVVSYYDTVFEAEVVCGKLRDAGIEALVQNENLSNVLPLGGSIQSLRPYVAVADDDAERAAEVLGLKAHAAQPSVCPRCGSSRIRFTFHFRGRPAGAVLNVFLVALVGLGAYPADKIRRAYYCRKCSLWF